MHNRMKELLLILGRIEQCFVRPPLVKLGHEEIEMLKLASETAGLKKEFEV